MMKDKLIGDKQSEISDPLLYNMLALVPLQHVIRDKAH